jgi:hypothetical protein
MSSLSFIAHVSLIIMMLMPPGSEGRFFTATVYRCESSKYGLHDKVLIPYFSVAITEEFQNQYPFGSTLFIPQLRGIQVNGQRHSGYFEVHDICADDCFQKADNSSSTFPVIDIHVGRGGVMMGGGAKKVTIKRVKSHRSVKRSYGGNNC